MPPERRQTAGGLGRALAAARLAAVAVLAAFVLAGCAASQGVVLEPPKERHALPSWPRQSIALQVVDARDRKEDSAQLVQVTAAVLSEALAAATLPPGPPQHLVVEILMHEVSPQGPMWVAVTRFRATLIEEGRALRTWEARGEQRQVNWVPSNARDAAQAAYHRALAGLVARLEQSPP